MKYYFLFWVMVWGVVCSATATERQLVWTGLTQEQGEVMGFSEKSLGNLNGSLAFSFLTYDSSSPTYNPTDPSTWTEEIWIGELVIYISSDEAEDFMNKFRVQPKIKILGNPDEYRRSEFVPMR